MIQTRASNASTAARRWARQYEQDTSLRKQAITAALNALPTNPDPDEVDRIIGNRSWTEVSTCDGCGSEGEPFVVGVGGTNKHGYTQDGAWLCGQCADDAKAAADEARAALAPFTDPDVALVDSGLRSCATPETSAIKGDDHG